MLLGACCDCGGGGGQLQKQHMMCRTILPPPPPSMHCRLWRHFFLPVDEGQGKTRDELLLWLLVAVCQGKLGLGWGDHARTHLLSRHFGCERISSVHRT